MKKYLPIILAVLACGFAVWHFRPVPVSPLTPQLVKDAKIPAGWYEHVVQGGGHTTRVVLTKHAELSPQFELDDLYDDPEIIIVISTLDASPEEYIRQYNTYPGMWGTLDAYGYKIFTFDGVTGREGTATVHVVDMFKDNTLYTFGLVSSANSALDTADFWQVINYYAQAQTPISPPSDEKTALAQLQTDMQSVWTPHFIPNNDGSAEVTYTPWEQKIRDDVITLYAAQYAATSPNDYTQSALVQLQNDTWLDAIGKRYLLITKAQKFAIDEVLDSQTGQITPISNNQGQTKRYYFAPERSIALYIDPQVLYIYSLNQAATTLVAGSQLSGTETYHNGYIEGMGIEINPQETHTKNSITISIFDSSKSVPNPDVPGATMYARVGQKTLSF